MSTVNAWSEMAVWVPDEGLHQVDTDLAELDRRGVRMSGAVCAVAVLAVVCATVLSVWSY